MIIKSRPHARLMFDLYLMPLLAQDLHPCRRKTDTKFKGSPFFWYSNVHSSSDLSHPHPSLPFPLPNWAREGKDVPKGRAGLGEGNLFHVQHITNRGQCPINRLFIDHQRRRKTDHIIMCLLGEDSPPLH